MPRGVYVKTWKLVSTSSPKHPTLNVFYRRYSSAAILQLFFARSFLFIYLREGGQVSFPLQRAPFSDRRLKVVILGHDGAYSKTGAQPTYRFLLFWALPPGVSRSPVVLHTKRGDTEARWPHLR